jgi:cytochrome bd ubiquinol oxidase subunit I
VNRLGVLLSRVQFDLTIGFHILWPAYTIGVSGFIVIVNALGFATSRSVYRDLLGSGSICLR